MLACNTDDKKHKKIPRPTKKTREKEKSQKRNNEWRETYGGVDTIHMIAPASKCCWTLVDGLFRRRESNVHLNSGESKSGVGRIFKIRLVPVCLLACV